MGSDMTPSNNQQIKKNGTNKKIFLGCGCGCLGVIIISLIVILILFGSSIMGFFRVMGDSENMTYRGKKVTQIADQQGLPVTQDNLAPKTNGVYKCSDIEMGLRFKTEFGKYTFGSGKVDLVLLSDETKCLHFKVESCGKSMYEIIDNRGMSWGFVSVIDKGETLILNDKGKLTVFKFSRDPRKRKK